MVGDTRYDLRLEANVEVSRIEAWILAEDDLEWSLHGVYRMSGLLDLSRPATVSFVAPTAPAWGQFRMWFQDSTISGRATVIEVSGRPD